MSNNSDDTVEASRNISRDEQQAEVTPWKLEQLEQRIERFKNTVDQKENKDIDWLNSFWSNYNELYSKVSEFSEKLLETDNNKFKDRLFKLYYKLSELYSCGNKVKLDADTKIKIRNRTDRKISIKLPNDRNKLLIHPFDSCSISKLDKESKECDLNEWLQSKLICIEESNSPPESSFENFVENFWYYNSFGENAFILGLPLAFLIIFFISLYFVLFKPSYWAFIIFVLLIVVLVSIVGLIGKLITTDFFLKVKTLFRRLNRETKKWISLFIIFIVSVIVPLAIAFFFGGGKTQLENSEYSNFNLLARIIQLIFIIAASLMPALFYFLFSRQQIDKRREVFYRETLMLDPNVQSLIETEEKYGALFEEIYGKSANLSIFGSGSPVLITTVVITLGWILVLLPLDTLDISLKATFFDYFIPIAKPINFGFLGAYFFTINMIYRRYIQADLTPKTYSYVFVRIFMTIILVWVISELNPETSPSILLVISFTIGVFPETGMALIQDFNKKVFGKVFASLEEKHPLTELEGINLYDRTRLLEEGIENIENLAHHNLIELVLRTRIPTSRIIDLFDQAILYLHVVSSTSSESSIQDLRYYGIRTATDLETAFQNIQKDKDKDKVKEFLNILDDKSSDNKSSDNKPKRLQVILNTYRLNISG